MNTVPVLSAGFGEGHNAAARAVAEALAAHPSGEVRGEVHDLFVEAYGEERARRQRDGYIRVANRYPRLWGCLYAGLDRLPVVRATLPLVRPVARRLDALLDRDRPRVVVSASPRYKNIIARRGRVDDPARPRLITVVTDSISVNRAWHRAHADWFVTPNRATAEVMVRQGVPAERVLPYGFPVPARLAGRSRAEPGGRPRVLLMLNPGRRDAVALAAALASLDLALTVTVGRDAGFREAVERAVAGRAEVLGWTDRIPELMLTSHLVVSKAGGATTHECVAAGVPMVITQVIPGQEAGNARLIAAHGAGVLGLDPARAGDAVAGAFADDWRVWRGWKSAVESLGDAGGARRVAELVVRELGPALAAR
ncbi:MAG: MGDG synthase family glycosyltransferase [Verrucomicrobiota bacterium]